ncbi:MAG: ABC transporter substrate-binding protein [Sulfobacillus thermosulfidooxidans]|uniref:ABC transporter substrate-binding protein n=1 Tax=Sulfobacillus thermosulfidooxidans TaxID=28034 RepID=A0A2T2WZG5_SULTH|nr:MAG: ABC transporter substrate-binding protein [Sulfobacillus thermosulfidooxidans]
MKRRSVAVLSAGIIGSSLVLAGCGSTSTPSTGSSQAVKSPVGNVAIVALAPQVSPNWWFPIEANTNYSDYNSAMSNMMYEPLIHISRTDGVNYNRSLASNVTWNSNGTVYTITLNKKWHWSNGQPVTSADVVWTMKLMEYLASGKAPWEYGGTGIGGLPTRWQSVKADGPYKVIVTLNQPSNQQWFLHNGLGQVVPVPKSVWDIHKNLANEAKFLQSVANSPQDSYYSVVDGPFKYSPQQSKPNDQYWTFVPNPNYDGHKASVSKVVYEYESSSSSEFAALKTGKVNVGYLPASLWNSKQELVNDKFSTSYLFGFAYMVPNFSPKAPGHFAQLIAPAYVRQALEMGIDQQGMINSFYHGHGVVEFSPIPSKPKTVFNDSAITNPAPFNPSAGKKLLEEHGWHMVNGVMTSPQGYPFKFTLDYSSGSNTMADEAQLMKQDWAKEGIDVTLESQPFNTLINDNDQANVTNWQMVWYGLWTYQPDFYPTGGGLFKTGAGSNSGDYSNNTMNALINKTYEPGTSSEITAAMDAYLKYAAEQLPVIWVPWVSSFNETAVYVHGVNKWFNPITDSNSPNRWTITH